MNIFLKSFVVIWFLILFGTLLMVSCGAKTDKQKNSSDENTLAKTEKQIPVPEIIMNNGKQVYHNYCSACHQVDGSGNPGMYPPVAKTDMVNGNVEDLIKVVLYGVSGPIEVNGEIYNQFMAPHNFLNDEQVADLLSYVRNSFGNSASMVKKEEVKKIREAGN